MEEVLLGRWYQVQNPFVRASSVLKTAIMPAWLANGKQDRSKGRDGGRGQIL